MYQEHEFENNCYRSLEFGLVVNRSQKYSIINEICPMEEERPDPEFPLGRCDNYRKKALVMYIFSDPYYQNENFKFYKNFG